MRKFVCVSLRECVECADNKVLIISMTISLSTSLWCCPMNIASIEFEHIKYFFYKLLLLQLSISSDVCSGNRKFGMSSKGRSLFLRFVSLMRSTYKKQKKNDEWKKFYGHLARAFTDNSKHISINIDSTLGIGKIKK